MTMNAPVLPTPALQATKATPHMTASDVKVMSICGVRVMARVSVSFRVRVPVEDITTGAAVLG